MSLPNSIISAYPWEIIKELGTRGKPRTHRSCRAGMRKTELHISVCQSQVLGRVTSQLIRKPRDRGSRVAIPSTLGASPKAHLPSILLCRP